MTSPSLAAPLTDSLDITHLICEHYSSLAPEEHAQIIFSLLEELHQIQYLSLSFKPHHNRAGNVTKAIEERLAEAEPSSEYRKALEWKMKL